MLRRLFISPDTPRDYSSFNSTFHEGLLSYKFFGGFFMTVGILLLIVCIFKVRLFFPFLLAFIFIGVGIGFRTFVKNKVKARENCFYEGQAVEAKVLSHHKTMFMLKPNKKNPFSSPNKHYSIVVEYMVDGKRQTRTLHHTDEAIWKSDPVGGTVIGLVKGDQSFFGEEIGTTFKYFNQ